MKYWVIAPMESTTPEELFQTAWEYDKHHGTIAVGFPSGPAPVPSEVSDVSIVTHVNCGSFDDFQRSFRALKEQGELEWGPRAPKMIWEFHREIQPGDKVIARRGLSTILGIGTVTKTAYYDFAKGSARIGVSSPTTATAETSDEIFTGPQTAGADPRASPDERPIPDTDYPYFRPRFIEVDWEHTGEFSAKLGWRRTVQEITREQFDFSLGSAPELQAVVAAHPQPQGSVSPTEPSRPTGSLTPTVPTPREQVGMLPRKAGKTPTSTTPTEGETGPRPAPTNVRSTMPKAILPQPPRRQPDRPNYYIGIDLGTTNSVMGWGTLNPQTNKLEPKVVEINMMIERGGMGKKELLPSCVYFKEESVPIVGEYAKTMIGRQTNRVVKSIKSEMGTQRRFHFNNTSYDASTISSQILKHLVSSAKALFGFTPDDVVITVPASFDSDMRAATIEAARLAGFRTQEDDGSPRNILLDEPRAALYDFINRQNKGEIPETLINFHQPQLVLVFDLGGGTLDVSLHRVSYQQEQYRLNIEDLAISRYTQIGGDDFDAKLADHFLAAYANRLPDNLDDFQMNLLKSTFREYAEQAKIDLSSEVETGKLMGYFHPETVEAAIIQTPFENQVFQYDLTLSEYEEVVEPLLASHLTLQSVNQLDKLPAGEGGKACDNIIYPILDVLQKAQRKLGSMPNVDAVLLNGGMTKLHTIQQRLETLFGFPPIAAGDPDKAVARGAVVYHYDLHRGIKPARILNDTIGIEIAGGRVKPLVEAGTILPLSPPKPIDGLQVSDGAPSLRLPFYLGSRSDTNPPNRRILERNVRFQRPLLKNEPIFLQVQVDERGIMNVEGWPKANPKERFTVSVDSTQSLAAERSSGPAPVVSDVVESSVKISSEVSDPSEGMRGGRGATGYASPQASLPPGSSYKAKPQPTSQTVATTPAKLPSRPVPLPGGEPTAEGGSGQARDRPLHSQMEPGAILDVRYELAEMKKNFSYYLRTYQINRKKAIMEQVTRQRTKISRAQNAEEFISPLLDNIDYVNNFGKARMMVLLGDLASSCSDTDLLYDICDAAIALSNPEEIKYRHPQVIKTVVRYAVEAIGKTRLPIAESHLINLLTQETPIAVRPSAVYSIGKCCHSLNAIEHLKPLIKYGLAADRIAINWAFGKMGSREHERPLPIEQLEPVVSILMEQLRTESHNDVKRNGIYALGEICDRRDCAADVIAVERGAAVIERLELFLNFRMDGSLSELANMQQHRMLQRFAGVSIQMIKGTQLSAEQETSLLTIRSEN